MILSKLAYIQSIPARVFPLQARTPQAKSNFVGGSVAVPLGVTSATSGVVTIVGGTALEAASEPIHAAFDKNPLPITRETVTPQPAPVVPHDAQTK